jgi:putative flippase GtrA
VRDILQRLLQSRFLRFALVGAAGFLVNQTMLFVALKFVGLDNYSGWIFAFLFAVTFTWWGNRTLTFHDVAAQDALWREWLRFFVANSFGAAANFATYSALVTFLPAPLGNPFVANGVGTLVGLVFNFTTSKRFVFRRPSA